MGLDSNLVRKIPDALPGVFDGVGPVTGGWHLTSLSSGIECVLQPSLRQISISSIGNEMEAFSQAVNIFQGIRTVMPTPHYLALTLGQTFHLPAGGERTSTALINKRLLSEDRDPLRNEAYAVGLRYYFAAPNQSTITVDPLLADPDLFFLQYSCVRPGAFAADDLGDQLQQLRTGNVGQLSAVVKYLLG